MEIEGDTSKSHKFDVEIYSELIKGFGVKGIKAQEVISIDDLEFEEFKQLYGIFIVYKQKKKIVMAEKQIAHAPDLFFASQISLTDAHIQATLSILLNSQELEMGETLKSLREFTMSLDPKLKGIALENSAAVKDAIYACKKTSASAFTPHLSNSFYYISFVPYKGKVFELDGLQDGPIFIGAIEEGKEWIQTAKEELQKCIECFTKSQTEYYIMAVLPDHKEIAEAALQRDQILVSECAKRLGLDKDIVMISPDEIEKYKKQLEQLPVDKSDVQNLYKALNMSIAKNKGIIELEEQKAKKWKEENEKRRHNYIPLILQMLKILDRKGSLASVIKKSVEEELMKSAK